MTGKLEVIPSQKSASGNAMQFAVASAPISSNPFLDNSWFADKPHEAAARSRVHSF
jgi:hypothetical protein